MQNEDVDSRVQLAERDQSLRTRRERGAPVLNLVELRAEQRHHLDVGEHGLPVVPEGLVEVDVDGPEQNAQRAGPLGPPRSRPGQLQVEPARQQAEAEDMQRDRCRDRDDEVERRELNQRVEREGPLDPEVAEAEHQVQSGTELRGVRRYREVGLDPELGVLGFRQGVLGVQQIQVGDRPGLVAGLGVGHGLFGLLDVDLDGLQFPVAGRDVGDGLPDFGPDHLHQSLIPVLDGF